MLESLIQDMMAYDDEGVKECKENHDKLMKRLLWSEWADVYYHFND